MQIILLYTGGGNGQVAFAANRFSQATERHYNIVDGVVTLSGQLDDILHSDASELLSNGLYRLPTPAEQEQMVQATQQASQTQEAIPIVSNEEVPAGIEQAPDGTGEVLSPDEPPALDNKKKASGG